MPPLDCTPTSSERRAAAPLTGQTVLAIIDAPNGTAPFADPHRADRAAEVLADPARWSDSVLLCWVILPTELRLLLRPGAQTPWPTLLIDLWRSALTQGSTPCVGDASPSDGVPGTRTYVLGRDDDLLAIANHVLRQPVRAGLARDLDDYRWWGAPWRKSRADAARCGVPP